MPLNRMESIEMIYVPVLRKRRYPRWKTLKSRRLRRPRRALEAYT